MQALFKFSALSNEGLRSWSYVKLIDSCCLTGLVVSTTHYNKMNVLIHVLTVVLYAAKLSDGLLSYNCKLQVPKKNSLMDKDVGGIRFKGERCLLLLIVYDRSGKDVQFLWNSCTKSHDSILYHHSSLQKDFVYDYIKDLTESLNYISQDCVNSFRRLNSTMTEFFEHKLTNTTNKRLARDVTVLIHPGKMCGNVMVSKTAKN